MNHHRLVRCILGDQLNAQHSWFQTVDPSVLYVMMEVRTETDYVVHHAQKVLAIFASMRRFAEHLRNTGHHVEYLTIMDECNVQSIAGNLAWIAKREGDCTIEHLEADEYRVEGMFHLPGQSTEHFLTDREYIRKALANKSSIRMEAFYRALRREHHVLMNDDGSPVGGQWNYDSDNRMSWKGSPAEPPDMRPVTNLEELWREICAAGVHTIGDPCADAFRWPLDRSEALHCLDAFISDSLPYFGMYQDAMSTKAPRLFHSLLSFALNIKLLQPMEVIRRAEQAYHEGGAPLHCVEGFIRQILGWREYIRGVYWSYMPEYAQANVLDAQRTLPRWFWDGNTSMACVADAVGSSLQQAYAHHIQRLMITGNIAALLGVNPKEVHEWYLGIYIDAFEWVELPNVIGMSQYADGGRMSTKPYVSSAAYINRMHDACKNCSYEHTTRTSTDSCPFNSLYWNFFERNEHVLRGNHRLGMVYKTLDKFSAEERDAIRNRAAWIMDNVNDL